MTDTVFRAARKNEAETVFALYRSVIGTPFCTWNEFYPGMSEIRHDLESEGLFVLEKDGRIIGAVSASPENELDDMDCWSRRGKVGEFARVVIHPDLQGRRLARLLVSGILDVMKERGFENIHISVAAENIPAQKTYGHFGFIPVGEEEMWGHLFYLYELNIIHSP